MEEQSKGGNLFPDGYVLTWGLSNIFVPSGPRSSQHLCNKQLSCPLHDAHSKGGMGLWKRTWDLQGLVQMTVPPRPTASRPFVAICIAVSHKDAHPNMIKLSLELPAWHSLRCHCDERIQKRGRTPCDSLFHLVFKVLCYPQNLKTSQERQAPT